jgi:anti-sigma B factor antagonist
MSFTYNLKQKSPVMVVNLYGDLLDRDECREMIDMLQTATDDGKVNIIFDLSDLRIMNSTGLNILVNTLTMARKTGGDVVLCGLSQKINQLFIISKLNTIFRVFDTEQEATEHYNNENQQ